MDNNITIKLAFEGEKEQLSFSLRRIRLYEQEAVYAQLAEVSELEGEKRADAQLKILMDALSAWAVDGKAVKAIFDGRDKIDNERIANAVIDAFFRKMTPTPVF